MAQQNASSIQVYSQSQQPHLSSWAFYSTHDPRPDTHSVPPIYLHQPQALDLQTILQTNSSRQHGSNHSILVLQLELGGVGIGSSCMYVSTDRTTTYILS
jgi:hypothetical protein